MQDSTLLPPSSGLRNQLNVQHILDCIERCELKRGNVITWAMLYEWLGFRDRPRTYPIIRAVNDRLQREHGWFLDNRRKLGYEIVETGKEVDVCRGVINGGIKRVRRGIIMMNHIRLDELSPADRGRTIETQQKAAALYRSEITA